MPGRFTAKLLYRWNNGRFERKHLEKLERNWRKWKDGKFFLQKNLKKEGNVMNQLDLIEELYNMYSEEGETPRIVEVVDDGLDFDLDNENRPADPYLKL